MIKDLSSRVIKKFNSYDKVKIDIKSTEKTLHNPFDIVYVPIKNKDDIINYFTDHLHLAFNRIVLKVKNQKWNCQTMFFFLQILFWDK